MQDVQVRPDIDLTLMVSEYTPPGCEGGTHPTGKWGHQPGQPAAYLTVTPCGQSFLMCAGWCEQRMSETGPKFFFRCVPGCWRLHTCDELTFIPID